MHDEKYYKDIGFMCGLEIHQRLATKEKLFCRCNAMLEKDAQIAEINRRQRAVAGELGKVDTATEFESHRQRSFTYQVFRNTSCLVDADEEPPHELNNEALEVAMKITASFGAKIPDEIEPMRKEVVDGSDPSAFQRTMLIGYSGTLKVGKKEINVPSIFLEEESSGIVSVDANKGVYSLNRFGIPLVEVDTDPEISNPNEAKEAAERIGLMLRLTGNVQRGIGSIRQDVNVSIKEGTRVEIKGFQDLDTMPDIIENEVERQVNLVKIRDMLKKRKAGVSEPFDVTDIFAKTEIKLIRKNVSESGKVYALRLKGFEQIIGYEINPGRRLGSEISDYAKLAGVGGIIHSDEDLDAYGFSNKEIMELRQRLGMKSGDAFLLVSGKRDICESAIKYAKTRAELALTGVPGEVRGADSKLLITRFQRPLPGGSRMYPETDTTPVLADRNYYNDLLLDRIDADAILKKLKKEINNNQLAEQMLWSPQISLYDRIIYVTHADPAVVASILLEKLKELKRSGVDVDSISEEAFVEIFQSYKTGIITKAAMEVIIKSVPKRAAEVAEIIKRHNLKRISGKELENIAANAKGESRQDKITEIMSKYRLTVDGSELLGILDKK